MIRSYKVAFVVLFVGLLVVTILAVSVNGYSQATRVSLDLSADIVAEMSANVVARASDLFEAARDLAEINAALVSEEGLADEQSLLGLFGRQLKVMSEIESIYVGGADGDFIQVRVAPQLASRVIRRPGGKTAGEPSERWVYRNQAFEPIAHINGEADYDPRVRVWYKQAVDQRGLQWSPVYRFASSEQHGITASIAVRHSDGSLLGVVGVDISLGSLSRFLTEQHLARGGVALIVGPDGKLIAYPHDVELKADRPQQDGLPSIDDLRERWIAEAYHRDQSGQARRSGINQASYQLTRTAGQTYLSHQQLFPPGVGDDWRLLMVVPKASLLEAARRVFSKSVAITFILVVVAAIAVAYLASRLFQPLRRLVNNTELIREFRFAEVERVPSQFAEIKAMDEAIWKMSQGLRSLEKFVPVDVGRKLIQSGKRVEPAAEVRELSLLFTGASNLANLCEALPAERIIELLGRQLDVFTVVILRHKGTIDNFLGESIFAFWGAPVEIEDGVDRACRAALACRDAEATLQAEWAKTLPAGEMAPPPNLYSVHHGRAIVGAIGSRQRMSWTAIGDNVALGWDLHQLNRRYGTRIIISGAVQREVADRYWTRRLDVLPLDSGERKLEVFELIDTREHPLPPAQLEAIRAYEEGLEALLEGAWDRAESILTPLAERHPDDAAVALMLSRCGTRDACFWPGLAGPRDDMLAGPFAARAVASPGLSVGHATDADDTTESGA
jgi:adenylate cyclase